MLAERARLPIVITAVAATFAIAIAVRPRCERAVQAVQPLATAGDPVTDFCPPHVRAAIHLGDDAALSCVRGMYPEPGTFVVAQYRTSEAWERFAVVGDDGRLLVPMLDRPAR